MKRQQINLQQREKLYSYSKLILPVGLGIEGRVKSWRGWGVRGGGGECLGAGEGLELEGQGPAHQSEAASVLHTPVRLGEGGRLPPIVCMCWAGGCPSLPPSARQSQLTLMNSEQDGTGWEEVRVL